MRCGQPRPEVGFFSIDALHPNRRNTPSQRVLQQAYDLLLPIPTLLPTGQKDANGQEIVETFTLEELGVSYPLLLDDNRAQPTQIPNPDYDPATMAAESPVGGALDPENLPEGFEPPMLPVSKLEFVYQIVWQEKTMAERLEKKEADRLAAEEAAEAEAQAENDAASS